MADNEVFEARWRGLKFLVSTRGWMLELKWENEEGGAYACWVLGEGGIWGRWG